MSRIASRLAIIATLGSVIVALSGCKDLDARNRIRKGNRLFKDSCFVQAGAEYEKALTELGSGDSAKVHYNLALALQKMVRPGPEKPVLLDLKGSLACETIPGTSETKPLHACIKKEQGNDDKCGDARFTECDEKNVCPSSSTCEEITLCQIPVKDLATMVTKEFQAWLTENGDDAETRALMTQVWLDTNNYKDATDYWEGLLKQKDKDPQIMGNLAGIALKAGDWRKSIEWYNKVADVTTDTSAKINAYQFIGNVGWAKLNSKTLSPPEAIELSDLAIGALQKAAVRSPSNPKFVGLQASIFNFRSYVQGASLGAAIDRASAQDLQRKSRVLSEEAKKAQGQPAPQAPATPPAAPAEKTGG